MSEPANEDRWAGLRQWAATYTRDAALPGTVLKLLAERDALLKVCKDAHTELDSAIWDGNTVDWMGRVVSRLESAIRATTTDPDPDPDRTEGG